MYSIFNEKMTVYNYINDTWKKSVVSNIQWRHQRNRVTIDASGKYSLNDSELVTIDFSSPNGYVVPEKYSGTGWTINPASKMDVIVQGEVEDAITEEFTIADLLKKYPGASGIVRGLTDARNRAYLPIIKVVAN